MAVPKKHHTSSRRDKRRTHIYLKFPHLIVCPNCKREKLPHLVCPFCGFYKGRKIMEIKKMKKEKEKKRKEEEKKEREKKKELSLEELSKKE